MKKILLVLTAGFLLAACLNPNPRYGPESPLPTYAPSSTRDRHPVFKEDAFTDLVVGNREFAFDLYRQLAKEKENLVFSPLSISTSLSMVLPGARGETKRQMVDVLHLPIEGTSALFNALDLRLNEDAADDFSLRSANALWIQSTDFVIEPAYLQLIAENYEAAPRAADFIDSGAREAARLAINAWVEQRTDGRVVELVEPNVLDELSRLVLVNAIYFKADWLNQFEFIETKARPFFRLDNSSSNVPMMHGQFGLEYGRGEGYQVVSLPYAGQRMRMLAMLPDAEEFAALQARMDNQLLAEIDGKLTPEQVEIWLPKYNFSSEFALQDVLGAMGMPLLFDEYEADLSGISLEHLYVSHVLHQALIIVDEEGTEAAGGTATVAKAVSAPPPAIPLEFNRPFIYIIQDVETGTVLFLGHVLDPTP